MSVAISMILLCADNSGGRARNPDPWQERLDLQEALVPRQNRRERPGRDPGLK